MLEKFKNIIDKYSYKDIMFVVGGGSSLDDLDLSKLDTNKYPVIVCNTAFRLFPNAILAHHCDAKWFITRGEELIAHFSGIISGIGRGMSPFSYPSEVLKLDCKNDVLDFSNISVISGRNSGQQALYIAHLFKPENIVLLGFDHTRTANGKSHFSGSDPLVISDSLERTWKSSMNWFKWFEKEKQNAWEKAGFKENLPKIINASKISTIKQYPKIDDIKEYLK